jgi:hypothetical protein
MPAVFVKALALAALCCATPAAADDARPPESPRSPRRLHVGADVLLASLDFSVEPGFGAGLHGHYRVLDSLFLIGVSYLAMTTSSHYEKCREPRCPESGGLLAADAELHFLDRSKIPVVDPWLGVRLGPAWSSGDFSYAAVQGERPDPGTTFGAGFELALGLDLHLWYAALGLGYRTGIIDAIGYDGLAARVQIRLF